MRIIIFALAMFIFTGPVYAGPVEDARKQLADELNAQRIEKAKMLIERIQAAAKSVEKTQEAIAAGRACLTKMETGDYSCYAGANNGLAGD